MLLYKTLVIIMKNITKSWLRGVAIQLSLCFLANSTAQAEVLRSSITVLTNRQVSLQTPSVVGQAYSLEGSATLNNWDVLQVTNATGNSLQTLDAIAGQFDHRFYRVISGVSSNAPNPLNVIVATDTNQSLTALIPNTGGELSLTNMSGVIYRLTIPTNALLGVSDIRLTVVTHIDAAPLVLDMVEAVDISPSDLLLMAPATLSIISPNLPAGNAGFGFAYAQNGQQFHLCPTFATNTQPNRVDFHIMRFGGYGIGRDSGGVVTNFAKRTPSDRGFRLDQSLALIARQATPSAVMAKITSNDDGNGMAALEASVREEFYNDVLPRLRAAEGEDRLLARALQHYAHYWLSTVELTKSLIASHKTNAVPSFDAEQLLANESAVRGIRACITRTSQRCQSSHELWLIGRLIQSGQLLEFPLWSRQVSSSDRQRLRMLIRQAASFDLSFKSRTIYETDLGPVTSEVITHVPVSYTEADPSHLRGQQYYDFNYLEYPPVPEVQISWQPTGSTLTVLDVALDVNPRDWIDPLALNDQSISNEEILKYMVCVLNPNIVAGTHPAENFLGSVHGIPVGMGKQYWALAFAILHFPELMMNYNRQSGGGYIVGEFSPQGGDIVAVKNQTYTGESITEAFELKLRHTPVQ